VEEIRYARPEWWLFNAALWMVLAGAVAFLWWAAWRVSPFLGWPRYYVAFLASRLLQRKRIAFFSVGAVTLCVAMMIIVISVMGGFVDSIRDRANGLLGDLVVDGSLQGFPFYREFIAEIGKLTDDKTGRPLVEQATPVIHSYGVLQMPDAETHAVAIRGIKLDEYVRVNRFGEDLFYRNRFGPYDLGAERGQPVYRADARGVPDLPGSWAEYIQRYLLSAMIPPLPVPYPVAMDEHYQRYVASLPQEKRADELKRFRRKPEDMYPGPGVIKPCYGAECRVEFIGPGYPGIIIGRDVLFHRKASGEYERDPQLYLGTACRLTVLPISRDGSVSQESPPAPWLRYIDDSKTGIHEIDSRTVYVDFDVLQSLMSMGPQEKADGGFTSPRCSQVMIKLHDEFSSPAEVLKEKKQQIKDVWNSMVSSGLIQPDPWEARMMDHLRINTWEEMQADFISAIEKEKFLVLIMFGVISIVAVFLILCIFYMIVQEKTRDVGIIKSVGASTEGVVAVFLVYGAAIGLVGCVLGSLLGTSFVTHINDIQDILARINPSWRVWSPETYSFDKIPSHWKWSDVLWISGLSIVSAIAGAAIPAMRAGRTWPVEALRYE
jgi:lipoprotein-releasing system permease protein